MKRTINVFLASSITEFVNERMAIENFIRNISDKFEESYDVKIQPLLCENLDDAYSKVRKQEEYNEKIRSSDFCFFIFFTKAGEYTKEEFEVARKKFEETGKPKIYTYFKVIHDEKAEQSLYDFMNDLDKTFGHYYGTFEHIDTVKLRILLQLKLQEMDFLEIKIDGDDCLVDGKKAALSLKNVSEFANNSIFQELKAELGRVESRYFELMDKYKKGECSKAEENEYIEIATGRQNLIDSIEEMQKNIFNMSLRMCQDEARGEITERQKEAYRRFEEGDLEGANNILDFAEMESEYLRDIAIIEANIRKRSEVFVRETKTKIDILKTMTARTERFDEIEALYDKILPVIFKYNVELEVAYNYVSYILVPRARRIKVAKNLEKHNEWMKKPYNAFRTYRSMGELYNDINKSPQYYFKAIELGERLAKENFQRYGSDLAMIFSQVGVFYGRHKQSEKEEDYLLKAIYIYESLSEINLERFGSSLANSYKDAMRFFDERGQQEMKSKYLLKTIDTLESLAKKNFDRFGFGLADSYKDAMRFFEKREPSKAEEYLIKIIEIKENFAETNLEGWGSDLVEGYKEALYFYEKRQSEKAEKYLLKAIDTREKLANLSFEKIEPYLRVCDYKSVCRYTVSIAKKPFEKERKYDSVEAEIIKRKAKEISDEYKKELADIYRCAGDFYANQGQSVRAEEYYIKAIKIFEYLATFSTKYMTGLILSCKDAVRFYENTEQFANAEKILLKPIDVHKKHWDSNYDFSGINDVADSYLDAGAFYVRYGLLVKAEENFLKAVEINEYMANDYSEKFKCDLVGVYMKTSAFYSNQCKFEKAEAYCLKAIEECERFAQEKTKEVLFALIGAYNQMAAIGLQQGDFAKSKKYCFKGIKVCDALPKEKQTMVAGCYSMLGGIYKSQGWYRKAKKYYLKAIKIYEQSLSVKAKTMKISWNFNLAACYNDLGYICIELGSVAKSERYFNSAIDMCEKLPKEFLYGVDVILSLSYCGLARLNDYDDYYVKKALDFAKKNPMHPSCRQIIAALEDE